MNTINITILGSTGTIGLSVINVINLHKKYTVFALTGYKNIHQLKLQCKLLNPAYAWIRDEYASELQRFCYENLLQTEVLFTNNDLLQVAENKTADIIVSAIVGTAGLMPTYCAVKTGKKILIANKESLVIAGNIIVETAKKYSSTLVPIDSEHNGIYQIINNNYNRQSINKIMLTASGGPLYDMQNSELIDVKAETALKHPNWSMGAKISIDSATLMNKGLELIEAFWLFGIENMSVLIHRQSMVHAIVEYIDGSMISQMSVPDMRVAISYALDEARMVSGANNLDLTQTSLTFSHPDMNKFPCLKIAIDVLTSKNTTDAVVLNSANEIAVNKYINGEFKFYDIPNFILDMLNVFHCQKINSIDDILILNKEINYYTKASHKS